MSRCNAVVLLCRMTQTSKTLARLRKRLRRNWSKAFGKTCSWTQKQLCRALQQATGLTASTFWFLKSCCVESKAAYCTDLFVSEYGNMGALWPLKEQLGVMLERLVQVYLNAKYTSHKTRASTLFPINYTMVSAAVFSPIVRRPAEKAEFYECSCVMES